MTADRPAGAHLRPDTPILEHGASVGSAIGCAACSLSDYFALYLCLAYFAALIPFLPTPLNLVNLMSNMWPLLVVSIGQTFVLTIAGIDLSQGAVAALTSVVAATLLATPVPEAVLSNAPIRGLGRLSDLIDRLKVEGRTIIYISHILGDVERVCDRIAVLRDGALVDEGATADFPVSRMIRSMIGRDLSGLFPERTVTPSEKVVFRADGPSKPGVLENVSLEIHSGEILGLFGLMGSGRSEFARAAFGLDAVEAGTALIDGAPVAGGARERIAAGLAFVTEAGRGP